MKPYALIALALAACAPVARVRAPQRNRAALAAAPRRAPVDPPPPEFAPPRADEEPSGPGRRAEPDDLREVCAVADGNLRRAADAVLAQPHPAPAVTPPRSAWDPRTPPRYFDLVARRFALRDPERAALTRNGFVVPERLEYPSFADALHDVYQSQLPLYVSADAVFNAVFRANDNLIADVEASHLAPLTVAALAAMHDALPAAAAGYPPEVARDVDLYLTVARSLLHDAPVPARLGGGDTDVAAARLVARARAASEFARLELFGRARMVDFSQYRPRGHYASRERLAPYFRGAMWLSRLEFNLVSRSSRSSQPGAEPDPRETPREATAALALADLAARAGALPAIARLDAAWAALAGRREDVSLNQLAAMRAEGGITDLRAPDAAARLRAVIGERFQRTARLHYMPEGSSVLPAIATVLGPRVVTDTQMLRGLTHGDVPGRYDLGVADVAYALGHDRARAYLAQDLARFPGLDGQLAEARRIVAAAPRAGADLYGAWFLAVRGLAARPQGAVPSFMETEAFADLRMNSIVAAFGQLRHNYVLIAGQDYDEGGCVIPDAYVEPVPEVYDALIAYAERGAAALAALEARPGSLAREREYFLRLHHHLRVLRAIVADELAGRPLTEEERRFLGMVVEIRPGSSDGPPTYTGWYFDLFRQRTEEGLAAADFIADFYTSTNSGQVAYAGARAPRMGLFVVDTNGPPRLMVGPVARAYEHHAPLAHRLDDEEARTVAGVSEPWARAYTVPAAPAPPLAVEVGPDTGADGAPNSERWVLTARSTRALGRVTFELLDHHYVARRAVTRVVGTQPVRVVLPGGGVNAVRVRVGAWSGMLEASWAGGGARFGGMPADENRDGDDG